MADAFVRYRQGGGYQSVLGYDYVLDTRKLVESGFYRDSGFNPVVIPLETVTISSTAAFKTANVGQGTSGTGYGSGTNVSFDAAYGTPVNFTSRLPDEISHTAPRQLSYYETTLSFFANSDVDATFTASNSSSRTLLTVADTSLFAGRPVLLSGADIPSATFPYQIYYPVALSGTTMLLQTSLGGDYVAWGDAGTGTLTVTVLDVLGQFQWSNILGWSNTPPTR